MTLRLILLAAALAVPGSAQGPESADADFSASVEPAAKLRAPARKGKKKSPAAAGLVYGKEMNGKKVTLRPGQMFVIQLAGDPANGIPWDLSRLDGIALDPVGDVEFHPDKVRAGAPRTGGTYTAGFRAMKPGQALVEFERRRAGSPVMAEDVFSLKVEVRKPSKSRGKSKSKAAAAGGAGDDVRAGDDGRAEDDGGAGEERGAEPPAEDPSGPDEPDPESD